MATWRSLAVLVLALVVSRTGWAQTYSLTETAQVGDCFHVQLDMKVKGEIRVVQEGKMVPMPLKAEASHDYVEKVLSVGSTGLPVRNARHYDGAKIVISTGDKPTECALRTERRLIVAERVNDQLQVYSADGPLTRKELELTAEHLDTLALTGLLPGKAVSVGETWKLKNPVAQALCSVEGLVAQDITCKLESVNGDDARISVTGTANGIELGAMIKLTVQGNCRYNLKDHRIVGLEWKRKNDRDQGPASPASTIEETTTLTRSFLEETPKPLSDAALVDVPDEASEEQLQLIYFDPRERYCLRYGREWQLVAQTENHLVMRLMEQGDFVAQVTVAPQEKASAGKHISGPEFKDIVEGTPKLEIEQALADGELEAETKGFWLYRYSVLGVLDELKVMQNCYLVAGPNGDQVILSFTMRPGAADKLGTRDVILVNGVGFPSKQDEEEKKDPEKK